MDVTVPTVGRRTGVLNFILVALFLLLLVLLGKISVSTTVNPKPPHGDCKSSPKFVPSQSKEFSNWSVVRYTPRTPYTFDEWHYYATHLGQTVFVGSVGILWEQVPQAIQATIGQATIFNPNVFVTESFRGKGIGDYMLRDAVSQYPKGTKFLWQQDPASGSGSYCWSGFLADFALQSLRVVKSISFPKEMFYWFIN